MSLTPLLYIVFLFSILDTLSCTLTKEQKNFLVDEHNRIRRTVKAANMLKIEYNDDVACVAEGYAEGYPEGINFMHNPNRNADYLACSGESGSVGENWYSGASDESDSFAGGATVAWCDYEWSPGCSERDAFEGKCAGVTGHFTQVVWAESYQLGCAWKEGFGTICNYAPAGNYIGRVPFIEGPACSECPETHPYCDNGLCTDKKSAAGTIVVIVIILVIIGAAVGVIYFVPSIRSKIPFLK